MSERKTIQIKPELFMVNGKNTTRKKQSSPKIKMKTTETKQKQNTLRKNMRNTVLKMVRDRQQEEYKRLFEKKKPDHPANPVVADFNKEFDDSLEFFSSLANKQEGEEKKNTTFKKYPQMNSVLMQPNTPIIPGPFPTEINELPFVNNATPVILKPQAFQLPTPTYGCLKNGNLPTYRTYHNKINPIMQPAIMPMNPIPQPNTEMAKIKPFEFIGGASNVEKEVEKKMDMKEMMQKNEKMKHLFNQKNEKRIKYLKRKKIFKRTYRVGRSKTKPQIGVLVSNRTVRNRISTTAAQLKQTPMQEVRKFLIKKGFIKVGTTTPNDVLRKMYESVSLVCGEIQNHNPENLLFNFIHDTT